MSLSSWGVWVASRAACRRDKPELGGHKGMSPAQWEAGVWGQLGHGHSPAA